MQKWFNLIGYVELGLSAIAFLIGSFWLGLMLLGCGIYMLTPDC
jgi:hypothetical protein